MNATGTATHHSRLPVGPLQFGLRLAAIFLVAACSSVRTPEMGYPTDRWQFEPLVADAEVQFPVTDLRPVEDTKFHQSEQSVPRYFYGDNQFFPSRMRVVATHFADAFPRDPPTTELVIRQLDVVDYVPRPLGDGRFTGDLSAIITVPLVLIGRAINPNRNSVACRLSGSYAGVAFSQSVETNYDQPHSWQHRKAVTAVLVAAVTKAIGEVRSERDALSSSKRRKPE